MIIFWGTDPGGGGFPDNALMSPLGTAAYRSETGLPPLVARAVAAAERHGFAFSCLPEQGRLLRTLAGGATDLPR